MKGLISFLGSVIVIALVVCVICWIFATDFFLLDILLMLGLFAIQIAIWVVVPIVIIIGVIWVIKEIFG